MCKIIKEEIVKGDIIKDESIKRCVIKEERVRLRSLRKKVWIMMWSRKNVWRNGVWIQPVQGCGIVLTRPLEVASGLVKPLVYKRGLWCLPKLSYHKILCNNDPEILIVSNYMKGHYLNFHFVERCEIIWKYTWTVDTVFRQIFQRFSLFPYSSIKLLSYRYRQLLL